MDFVIWFFVLVYMEVILRVFCLSQIFGMGIVLAITFSLLAACIIKLLTSLFKEKTNWVPCRSW